MAAKCGEDLFKIHTATASPLDHIDKNNMLVQYNETDRALNYLIDQVPNGLSLLRSAFFKKLRLSELDLKSKLLKIVFSKPIIASEITQDEKREVIRYFTYLARFAEIDQRRLDPEVREKFKLIFVISEPSL